MARLWTDPERLAAMYLYCQLPFGQLHSRNPAIIALAERLDRSADSVAMKLTNFASLDPDLQSRGIKGLPGAGKGDRALWRAFLADWDAMVEESATAYDEAMRGPPTVRDPQALRPWGGGATSVESTVAVRRGQDWFRGALLAAFDGACCVSGCDVPSLLVASHIARWAEAPMERLNPRNGLLLSTLHDRAFEEGFLAVDDDYTVLIASSMRRSGNPFIQQGLARFHGQPLRLPNRFVPDPGLLREHREARFAG